MEKFLALVHKVVSFLEGKKANIASFSGFALQYFVYKGWVGAEDGLWAAALIVGMTTGTWAVGKTQSYQLGKSK